MYRRITAILLIIIILILITMLSSCNSGNEKTIGENIVKDSNDKIQLWYYIYKDDMLSSNIILEIVSYAKSFCAKNKIPLEVFAYDDEILAHKDYIFKRNLAAANGNMIIIEDKNDLTDLAKHHADYTKLENYDKLIDGYKNRYVIPMGVNYLVGTLKNEILQYYNVTPSDKLIMYTEYLNIKQEMKKKGAKFLLNYGEFHQLIDYYLYLNEVLFIDDGTDIFSNNSEIEALIKEIAIEVYDDILLYYNTDFKTINENFNYGFDIIDNNSEMSISAKHAGGIDYFIDPRYMEELDKKTFYIDPFTRMHTPNFFMHKKITNGRIYELANYLISEDIYSRYEELDRKLYDNFCHVDYMPVFKIDKIKELLHLNEDLEFVNKLNTTSQEVIDLINNVYEVHVKDEEKSKEAADSFFFDDQARRINHYVKLIVLDIVERLADGDKLEKYDPNNVEINKIMDDKIKELILEYNIRN